MTDRIDRASGPSRRWFIAAGSTLLAGFGLEAAPAAVAEARQGAGGPGAAGELATHRPVHVSSTDYAPTPGAFAVDGLSEPGVRGSGWRAASGDPQWISVDLQADCEITSVRLTFEAAAGDPVFEPPTSGNPRSGTTGKEILSSYAESFAVETSTDGKTWTTVHRTTDGRGGAVDIPLSEPVTARWVRMTSHKRSSALPLGLNGFAVYGKAAHRRPAASGWTDWGRHHHDAPALHVAQDGTVPVESGWVLTMDEWAGSTDGAELSRHGVDTDGWLPATVPGTVLGSLVDQGKLPDPVVGLNNLRIPEALSRHAWWYRREFTVPSGLSVTGDRRTRLEFDGINHEAEVWLNGTRVGDLAHPFARAAFDVTDALEPRGRNVLAVRIKPMPLPGSPGDKGPAGEAWVDAGADTMNKNSPTYLATSGWDWMPAVRDRAAGIWNHVRLRSTGAAVLGDPRVDTLLPKLPDTSVAELTLVVPVHNTDQAKRSVTVKASFDGVRVTKTVEVAGGASTDVVLAPDEFAQLKIRRPRLWWPNGLGDAALHDLTLTASVAGRQSDVRRTRFGIRQFGYEYDVPLPFGAGGSEDASLQSVPLERTDARYVRVACKDRATDWGFSLWSLSVLDSRRAGTDLALHAAADASSTDTAEHAARCVSDGDTSTRWSSEFSDRQWIQVDLGSVQSVDRVDLLWEKAYARTFTVQVSADGDTWHDAASVDNTAVPLPFGASDASLQVRDIPAQTARHVRLKCGVRQTSWGVSLWTLSVFSSEDAGTDLALHGKATASTQEDDKPASNVTDGDSGTRWSSAYEDDQWIQVDLGQSRTFDRVALLWERAYPKTYTLQVSEDGQDWKDVETVSNEPEPLKISVNGVRVLARGGNWGWDELLRRMPDARMDAAVRMHRDMNFTMIRNWVGSSDREEFFAACDEHGILVWNDFPNAWGMDPPDHDVFNGQAADTVLRYRIHPSIVVWCGANEGDPPAAVDEGMRRAVESGAPGILYQNNSAGGIVTGGGPYGFVEPEKYFDPATYGSKNFGFHTEIGMPVVSTADSLRAMTGDEPEWPIGGAWYLHDWSERGNQAPQNYKAAIEARLGASKDLDDFARKAQFVNFENARAMFEAWNAHLWDDATGLMLWMSHPAWHSTVWQTYDYDFDVNGMYYGARSACEPLHVQAHPGTWQLTVVNHTGAGLRRAGVTAELYDLTGRRLGTPRKHIVDVAAATRSADLGAVPWADTLPDLHLLRLTLKDAKGRTLSTNTYWRHRTPAAMKGLSGMDRTRLTVGAPHVSRAGDRRRLTATVRNAGSAVAPMTRLSLRETHGGDRVLPTLYSHNYLWLLPGESQEVTLSWPEAATKEGARVALHAQAYNSAETSRHA
ncbi:glycoside hydrolase [Streptomyces sp. SID5785]|uniref:discoidin domain-containing protein n=1 Tax=Streptomyces sp. SID5785 TaxID=2690309 RepID=UPI001361067C|nr:discoidin domain-containing protein [Streptomyces sp. SID5785]MZD08927.1 glycoside hydrolase [Streptomyces sp. SID5785]